MIICPFNSPLKESEKWLSRYGFQINTCDTLEQANKYYELSDFDLLLIDQESINTLDESNTKLPDSPRRIVLDARASLSTGVSSMALGAIYYLPLPTDSETLLKHVVNALEASDQAHAKSNNSNEIDINTRHEIDAITLDTLQSDIIGECPAIQSLFADMQKIATTDATVLIRGESGTGKELVARALHKLSPRNKYPIINVNCAAIPDNLIESELFGHEKGAFTGATSAHEGLIYAADKGTLFLDEIGELPLEAQARLLRVLQESEIRRVGSTQSTKVDIRIVTATHRDLMQMVRQGLFREDLYYRLYVMELLLPPLRDRGDDISLIAEALLDKICRKHNMPTYHYNKAFNKAIRSHNWPGNVRELENAIERAVILSPANKIEAANLKLTSQQTLSNDSKSELNKQPAAGTTLDDYLKHFVLTHQHEMTETQLAQSLGISRKSLWERRQKLTISKKVTP